MQVMGLLRSSSARTGPVGRLEDRGINADDPGPAHCLAKGTRFHDLRHFYASTLIAANLNPKVIQARKTSAGGPSTRFSRWL